jgi:RimJ/RimL family protein N-acetyltransferase
MMTGERVRLRALEPADSETMWRWYHDPEIGRWMDGAPPISLAQNIEKGQTVGFVEEGRRREAFRTRGKRHDFLMMGLLSSELR